MTREGAVTGLACGAVFSLAVFGPALANWDYVRKYVKPTHRCGFAQEVLVTYYWEKQKLPDGSNFNPKGLTAAGRGRKLGSFDIGERLLVMNPRNGYALILTINDSGPYGEAWDSGVKIDISREVARILHIIDTQTICVF